MRLTIPKLCQDMLLTIYNMVVTLKIKILKFNVIINLEVNVADMTKNRIKNKILHIKNMSKHACNPLKHNCVIGNK